MLLHHILFFPFVILVLEQNICVIMDKTMWTRNTPCSFSWFRSLTFLSQGDIWSLNACATEVKEDVNLHNQYSIVFEKFDPKLEFSSTSGSYCSDLQSYVEAQGTVTRKMGFRKPMYKKYFFLCCWLTFSRFCCALFVYSAYLLICFNAHIYTCIHTYIHTYLFTYSLIYLFIELFTYLLTYFLTYLFAYLLICLLTYLLIYWIIYLLAYLLPHLLICLLTYLFTYSLIYLFIELFT